MAYTYRKCALFLSTRWDSTICIFHFTAFATLLVLGLGELIQHRLYFSPSLNSESTSDVAKAMATLTLFGVLVAFGSCLVSFLMTLAICRLYSVYAPITHDDVKQLTEQIDHENWLKVKSPFELLEVAIERIHAGGTGTAKSLAQIITSKASSFWDVEVNWRFVRLEPSAPTYTLMYNMRFNCHLDEIIVAVTPLPLLQHQIAQCCPQVCYVFVPSKTEDIDKFCNTLMDPGDPSGITVTLVASNATRRTTKIDFSEIIKANYPRYLPGIEKAMYNQVQIVKAPINRGNGEAVDRIELAAQFQLNVSDKYAYWIADRPMRVSRFSVDVSQFLGCNIRGIHKFLPVMGPSGSPLQPINPHGQLIIQVDDWLLAGHGILLRWD